MPICPRCGKCLSSDQALTYHLNRKYRCGTWKCTKCNDIFNTKFHLQMHEMKCLSTDIEDNPTVDYLLQIYNNLPYVIINVNDNNQILNISPNFKNILKMNKCDIQNNIKNILYDEKTYDKKIIFENDSNKVVIVKLF